MANDLTMTDSQQSIFAPSDWASIRRTFLIYGAVLLIIAIAVLLLGKSLVGVILAGLVLMWFVALGLGFFYFVRLRQAKLPRQWPIVLNVALFFVSYSVSAFVLPVFAATFDKISGQRHAPAQFLLDLSNFLMSWWWVLLTIGCAMLGLCTEALSERCGQPAAVRGLRWLTKGQIIYLVALVLATFLAHTRGPGHGDMP